MSQTNQQAQGAAPATLKVNPTARKDWEMFWRIVAGLMLVVIVWVIWVLYQITPRSVVTPMAYEPRLKPIGAPQAAAISTADATSPPQSAAMSAVQAGAPLLPVTQRSAAELALEQAQVAVRAGAHQASADVQAAAAENALGAARGDEQPRKEGLKLSTEIGTPLAQKKAPERQ